MDRVKNSGFSWEPHGKRHRKPRRWGVYISNTAVCDAQIGISIQQLRARCMHNFFKWPRRSIRASIAFTSKVIPFPVYRWRTRSIKPQIQICVIIGCPLPDAEESRACRIGILPLVHRKLTPARWPFWAGCRSCELNWTLHGCLR